MANESDIDRLERRERELLKENARLRALIGRQGRADLGSARSTLIGRDELFSAMEKTRMPMILTDPNQPDDPIIFVNRAFQELSGYPAAELLGRNCRFLQGEGTDLAQIQQIRDALATNSDIAIEILNYRRDGSPFMNELYISAVFDHDGRLLYRFGSQLDVSGFRKARDALEVSERRQRAIFDSSVDFAIVVTDRQSRVTDWNTGAERIFGWSAEAVMGQTVERIFTPEDCAAGRPEKEMAIALAEGRSSDERWHVRATGSRFFASGQMMPLRDAKGEHRGFVKIISDRTTEHLAAEQLRMVELHRGALLRLSDRFGENEGVGNFTDAACAELGWTLGVDIVAYGEVDSDVETITVERDWTRGGAPTLAGAHSFRAFGSYMDDLRRGETVTVLDARTDTRDFARGLVDRGATAFVDAPVLEHGRLVGLLHVGTTTPRNWTRDELLFIREVADRTRAATARRQAENALRASEANLRLVADALPMLVAFVDRTQTYQFANEAYRDWFDRTPDQVIGRTVREITGSTGYEDRRPAIERALAGEPVQLDVAWPWPDGRRRIADIRYTPRRDLNGTVEGFYVFVQDVTAQRNAEAVLTARTATLEREVAERTADRNALWQLSRELMLRCTFKGVITAVNPAWTEILGWREDELLGADLFDFIHPDDMARTIEGAKDLSQGVSHARLDNRYRSRSGEYRWISWSTRDAEGIINAVGRDVTAEREQAEALANASEALRQSQKMDAVGQLTGGVAHDFNNLLTIIRSSVDYLRRPNLPDDRRKRYMDAVSDTVDRAAKLTNQLLAFSRRQALKPEVFDVASRLRAVVDMLDTVTGARVSVVTELPDRPCHVRADVSQFETALVNMAVNARDAMDGAGTLTLRLECDGSMPPIRGHAGVDGDFAIIEIRDTGTGIAPGQLGHIFEPFFTTKEVGKGTGLGLSQVFGFAKQSGGDVDVESELGRGSTFRLYLPEVRAEPDKEIDDDRDGPAPGGGGRRVLVVEDNVEVGRFATQILEDLGYRTTWAANAEAALERLGNDGDGFDVVFSDVVMPGMGGLALAQELSRRLPKMPVLLASGYSHVLAEDTDHGFELLQKPYSADELSRILRRVIGARRRKRT